MLGPSIPFASDLDVKSKPIMYIINCSPPAKELPCSQGRVHRCFRIGRQVSRICSHDRPSCGQSGCGGHCVACQAVRGMQLALLVRNDVLYLALGPSVSLVRQAGLSRCPGVLVSQACPNRAIPSRCAMPVASVLWPNRAMLP